MQFLRNRSDQVLLPGPLRTSPNASIAPNDAKTPSISPISFKHELAHGTEERGRFLPLADRLGGLATVLRTLLLLLSTPHELPLRIGSDHATSRAIGMAS